MFIIFMFLLCLSTLIIVYIIISPLNSYRLYIGYWILKKYYIIINIRENLTIWRRCPNSLKSLIIRTPIMVSDTIYSLIISCVSNHLCSIVFPFYVSFINISADIISFRARPFD